MEREEHEPSAFTSTGREAGTWKSPRKIQEEINLYRRKRFEFHMELEDIGFHTSRELALAAFRAELEDSDPPTEPIDTNEIKRLLDD